MKLPISIKSGLALVLSLNLLSAQNSATSQSAGAVVVSDGGQSGSQTFSFGGFGTNDFDANALSKAIQDGMKQVFGNGGSNFFSGRGGWDPSKLMQQFNDRMLDNVRDALGFTNDAEWQAVRPLVEKVTELQQQNEMAAQTLRSRRMFGGNNVFLRNFGSKGMERPEHEALQKAVDENASPGQLRDAIARFRAAQKENQSRLEAAQAGLRKVLTAKQEAQAILLGLLD